MVECEGPRSAGRRVSSFLTEAVGRSSWVSGDFFVADPMDEATDDAEDDNE